MKLCLTVVVPLSATPPVVHAQLVEAAANRQGITLLTPELYAADVDLVDVVEVAPDPLDVRHGND